jgi:hypothetical protein
MRVILSRKGLDSGYGGQPSPILPDGTMLSLPIPRENDPHQFNALTYNGKSYYDIIRELKPNTEIRQGDTCHLDPDLRTNLPGRTPGWKGLFGQEKAAAGHLRNNKVDTGDIFLFFGWFKEAEIINGCYRYKKKAPDLHVIFGYLEIGAIYRDAPALPAYAKYHPHARYFNGAHPNNIIYEAAEHLSLNKKLPGWGCLTYGEDVQLTKDGEPKSHWKLPDFFRRVTITYHNQDSFKDGYFQSTNKGQEFVISESPKITEWAEKIIVGAGAPLTP